MNREQGVPLLGNVVDLRPGYNLSEGLAYNSCFNALTTVVGAGAVRFVVFRAARQGSDPDALWPRRTWEALPNRTVDGNAKGMGIYTGNRPEAVEMAADNNPDLQAIGVFQTPPINRDEVLNCSDGSSLWAYGVVFFRHLGYKVRTVRATEREIVEDIDTQHEDARAVLLTPAPTAVAKGLARPALRRDWSTFRRRRQALLGSHARMLFGRCSLPPEDVPVSESSPFPAGWLLWRDVEAPLERIGTVRRS